MILWHKKNNFQIRTVSWWEKSQYFSNFYIRFFRTILKNNVTAVENPSKEEPSFEAVY